MTDNLFPQLESELKPHLDILSNAAEMILLKDISKYPILVIHSHSIELGVQVTEEMALAGKWTVNASTLEEFAMKQIISSEKIEDFQAIYKDPEKYLCLFVILEPRANFIFIPKHLTSKT